MEDIAELTQEELLELTPEELTERVLEQNRKAIEIQARSKEIEHGATQIATKYNDLKKSKESDIPVAELVTQQLEQSKVNDAFEWVLEQIPEENREAFKTTFEEIRGDNKLTLKNFDKLVKATLANLNEGDAEAIKSIAVWSPAGWSKPANTASKFAQEQKALWKELFGGK